MLGISFYDKELIRLAAVESGLNEELFEKADEVKGNLFRGWFGLNNVVTSENYTGFYLSNETLFKIQSDVIRSLAEKKSCLFVGRCADYVLKDYPETLNIFIIADMDDRARRVAGIQSTTLQKARECIEKTDKKRSEYYSYFTGKSWGAAGSYHVCVNSSIFGIDGTVDLLRFIAGKRFGL